MQLPNLNGVRNASDNLKDVSIVTPLELSERLSNEFNSRVFFKREDVQKVRSFKIRGAFNKIKSLNLNNTLDKQIICASAGNHAQGFAYSCAKLKIFGTVYIAAKYVEFLIPITILITAIFHLFTAGKSSKKESISFIAIITLFFGVVHGLGFSNYFNSILPGSAADKLLPLLEFALGIEAAQIIVVFMVLIIAYIAQTFFRFSKRDWALVMSAFIIGVVLPMLIENEIWNR